MVASKILILFQNTGKDKNLTSAVLSEYQFAEIIEFTQLNELPLVYDSSLYYGLLWFVHTIDYGLIEFFQKLRGMHNRHRFMVIGHITDEAMLLRAREIEDCEMVEAGQFPLQQLQYQIGQFSLRSGRELSRQALRKELLELIQSNPSPFLTMNPGGIILNVNPAFSKCFGYINSDLQHKPVKAFLPDLNLQELHETTSNQVDLLKELPIQMAVHKSGRAVAVTLGLRYFSMIGEDQNVLMIREIAQESQSNSEKVISSDCFAHLSAFIKQRTVSEQIDFLNPETSHLILKMLASQHYEFLDVETEQDVTGERFKESEKEGISHQPGFISYILNACDWENQVWLELPHNFAVGREYEHFLAIPVKTASRKYGLLIAFYDSREKCEYVDLRISEILGNVLAFFMSREESLFQQKISENHFKKLVENAQDGIYQSTPQGKIVYANPAFLQMLGFRELSEATGKFDARDLYSDPSRREEFVSQMNRNGSVRNFHCALRTKDNRSLSVIENAHIIQKADNSVIYEGILRDVTEAENLRKDLKTSQDFSNELMDKANILIGITDKNYQILFWNQKAQDLSGYSREDFIGNPDLFNKIIGITSNHGTNQSQTLVQNQEKNAGLQISTFMTDKNDEKIIGWTRTLFQTKDLGALHVFFGIDLTENRRLEERLIEAGKNEVFAVLASRVAQGFDELFTSSISNLTSIQNSSEITALQKNYFIDLESSLRRGLQLTRQLISMTKSSDLSYRPIKPNDLVEQAVILLKQTCPANIIIESELTATGMIEAEPAQLYQAILNIALNALEAMPSGGRLNISTGTAEPDPIHAEAVSGSIQGQRISIVISDTGSGIRDEDKKHIFDPFFSTKENSKTRGIGLTLTQKIVREHRGSLIIDSELNSGTKVTINLPALKKSAPRQPEAKSVRKTDNSQRTVLVVDDESIIRDLIEDLLTDEGYQILLAENGVDAMQIYESHPQNIDLVILDIIMPKMDGRELFFKMRELNPGVKIIITSGFSKPNVKEELMEKGANGFLPKPFTINLLTDLVQSVLH